MKVEILSFETAVSIGKIICQPAFSLGEMSSPPTLDDISKQLDIRLNTLKRWLAESLVVEKLPVKALITDEFTEADGSPLEILAFFVFERLALMKSR